MEGLKTLFGALLVLCILLPVVRRYTRTTGATRAENAAQSDHDVLDAAQLSDYEDMDEAKQAKEVHTGQGSPTAFPISLPSTDGGVPRLPTATRFAVPVHLRVVRRML